MFWHFCLLLWGLKFYSLFILIPEPPNPTLRFGSKSKASAASKCQGNFFASPQLKWGQRREKRFTFIVFLGYLLQLLNIYSHNHVGKLLCSFFIQVFYVRFSNQILSLKKHPAHKCKSFLYLWLLMIYYWPKLWATSTWLWKVRVNDQGDITNQFRVLNLLVCVWYSEAMLWLVLIHLWICSCIQSNRGAQAHVKYIAAPNKEKRKKYYWPVSFCLLVIVLKLTYNLFSWFNTFVLYLCWLCAMIYTNYDNFYTLTM